MCKIQRENILKRPIVLNISHSTVVEWATYMRVYAGLSPTGADHRKELKSAFSCSLNDVK